MSTLLTLCLAISFFCHAHDVASLLSHVEHSFSIVILIGICGRTWTRWYRFVVRFLCFHFLQIEIGSLLVVCTTDNPRPRIRHVPSKSTFKMYYRRRVESLLMRAEPKASPICSVSPSLSHSSSGCQVPKHNGMNGVELVNILSATMAVLCGDGTKWIKAATTTKWCAFTKCVAYTIRYYVIHGTDNNNNKYERT